MCEMFSFGEEPQLANVPEENKEIKGHQQQVFLTALESGIR